MGAITQSIGLFGVTGELGRAFFDALEEQGAFVGRLRLFASARSAEESRVFRDKPLAVEEADTADFDDLNEAILAVPADVASLVMSLKPGPVALSSSTRILLAITSALPQ